MHLENEYIDSGGSCWLPIFGRAMDLPTLDLDRTWHVGAHAFRRYFSVFIDHDDQEDHNVIGLYKCANYDELNDPTILPPVPVTPEPDEPAEPEPHIQPTTNTTGDLEEEDSDGPGAAIIIIVICLGVLFLGVIGWIIYKRRRSGQDATFATGGKATRL